MADASVESEMELIAGGKALDVSAVGVHGGDNHHHVPSQDAGVEVDLAAHHLGDFHRGRQGVLGALGENHVAGADTQGDVLGGNLLRRQVFLLFLRQGHLAAADGDIVLAALVEKLGVEAGEKVTFDNVLAVSNESLKVGDDVANATVEASVVENGRGKKVIVYKYKRKTGYHKKNGHRQSFTKVKIEKING